MMGDMINTLFDKSLSPTIAFGPVRWPTWRLAMATGMLFGLLVSGWLAAPAGLAAATAVAAAALGVLACVILGLAQKVWRGYESYTFYHYQMFIFLIVGLALWGTRTPVLPYLDLIALSVATALAVGRLGCHSAGCCHGRPADWGVRYGAEHQGLGFTPHFVGVRLFPIQLAEALGLTFIVASGSGLVLAAAPVGSALAWYVLAYGALRFFVEGARGDTARPQWRDFSAAQWTSLLNTTIVGLAAAGGVLPGGGWLLLVPATLVAIMAAQTIVERWRPAPTHRRLAQPRHLAELVAALQPSLPVADIDSVAIRLTTLGVGISSGPMSRETGATHHYTISLPNGRLDLARARWLARQIRLIRHPDQTAKLQPGAQGTYHIIL